MLKPIEERVKDLVADQLSVEAATVALHSRFSEDLGADSLDAVELVMRFEEEFEMEIQDEAAENFATVGDVVAFLKEAGKEA